MKRHPKLDKLASDKTEIFLRDYATVKEVKNLSIAQLVFIALSTKWRDLGDDQIFRINWMLVACIETMIFD